MTKIRPWTEGDVPQIAEIEKSCFSAPWTESMLRDSFKSSSFCCLVAEEGGQVIGSVTFQEAADEVHIANLAVRQGYRRQGVAMSLIERLIALAEEKGMRGLTLEVRASNAPARSLYGKMGFFEAGGRKKFYGDEDGVIMWKNLR